ncbi:MAG TPA: hypothetical protein DDZ51_09525 [Planctomycetaceae bacterium]|nr:hypothetical protein [Planctomycetaceae bacterium]
MAKMAFVTLVRGRRFDADLITALPSHTRKLILFRRITCGKRRFSTPQQPMLVTRTPVDTAHGLNSDAAVDIQDLP